MTSKVHRVRFYNSKPQAINCVALNRKSKLIALARADASIEIWDVNKAPYLVRFIPGVENGSVEALGWVADRLLSTGLNGALIEWDIVKQKQKTSVILTGYAAWCLDVNCDETVVAVGTEQGYINLYSVDNDEIVYNRLFDKQDGRIMCCKFDKTGNTLVTGSIDSIRVWNVKTGHAITRMSVSRRQKEVVVWCVDVLPDNTIVSGDSYGRLTFWDGTLGEQIESFPTHKADILTIAVSEDEQSLYCSGIDPIISQFTRVSKSDKNQKSQSQWVKHVQRHIHQHDVRALVVNDGKLISVGVDGYLTFSSYPPKWVMRHPPMIPTPRSYVCSRKKLLLLRYGNHLEVWKLGSYATNRSGDVVIAKIDSRKESNSTKHEGVIEQDSTVSEVTRLANINEKQSLKVTENPVKLVSIQAKHKKQIQCCAMSPSGEFIVYSTDSDTRMLKLNTDEDDQSTILLSKVVISGLSGPCHRIAFSDDSFTMVAYNGSLHILHVDADVGATVIQTLEGEKALKTTSILHLLVSKKTSSGSTYIVLADSKGVIEVLVDKKKKFVPYITLPKYQCVPTALTVDPGRESLIVVYSDQTILEYNLQKKKVSEWPGAGLPELWLARTNAVESVCVHPRTNALVLQDETSLWTLDRNLQAENAEPEIKRKPSAVRPLDFSVIPLKYLAGFHWLGDDEAVTLEVLPENIVAQLPAPVQINKWM